MNTLGAVLDAFSRASGHDADLWEWPSEGEAPVCLASSSGVMEFSAGRSRHIAPPAACAQEVDGWAAAHGLRAYSVGSVRLPAWLVVAPAAGGDSAGGDSAAPVEQLLTSVLPHVRRLVRERDGATHELAERYEEISLLYAIGELLGSGASVESVGSTILRELAQTVGAHRGALMLHDPARNVLVPSALLGIPRSESTIVSLDKADLLAVRAFRTGETGTEDGGARSRAVAPLLGAEGGPVLAVPIRRAAHEGTVSLGTLMLARRADDAPFSAGDRKLVTAIASQVGTALHNARLVRAALEQEQLAREMRLAHDLQLKLLPAPAVVGPEARGAARVVPAESVGGDFYLLARLGPDRTGVVIGDVSGHGYRAALVMALAMSAVAIHVQAVIDPAVALEAVRRSLADELESTEMSITMCYAVIDGAAGVLRYASAGHPHAFLQRADGRCERLPAMVPPLGFSEAPILGGEIPWSATDRLVLFTDGLPDARGPAGDRFGEPRVLELLAGGAGLSAGEALRVVMDAARTFVGDAALVDDLAMVVVERGPAPPGDVAHEVRYAPERAT